MRGLGGEFAAPSPVWAPGTPAAGQAAFSPEGTVLLSQCPSFRSRSRISQLNMPGFSRLYSSIFFSTSGVATCFCEQCRPGCAGQGADGRADTGREITFNLKKTRRLPPSPPGSNQGATAPCAGGLAQLAPLARPGLQSLRGGLGCLSEGHDPPSPNRQGSEANASMGTTCCTWEHQTQLFPAFSSAPAFLPLGFCKLLYSNPSCPCIFIVAGEGCVLNGEARGKGAGDAHLALERGIGLGRDRSCCHGLQPGAGPRG